MNKRLLAVAVTGALSSVAAATAQAEVTIYGRIYPQFEVVKQKDPTPAGTAISNLVGGTASAPSPSLPSRQNVNSSSSAIGFRASTDLGGGMKGFMQIESDVVADEGDGFLASRSTFVGLSGGFGTVYLGRMDTVYKDLGGPVSFLGVSAGNFVSESNIISKNGMGTRNSTSAQFGAGFHRRQNHMIRYETPEFGGVQFLAQYSPDEDKNNTSGGPTAGLNRTVTSMGAKWESGPLYLALAHEIHKDFFGGSVNASGSGVRNANVDFFGATPDPDAEEELILTTAGARSKDTATRVSWSWELMKDTKIGGDFARLTYKETGGATGKFEKYEHNTWDIGVSHKMGNITLAANYANSDEGTCALVGTACSTRGLEGNAIALGVLYSIAKQVGIFGLWGKLENGASARYDNIENGSPQRGEDIDHLAVGVVYRF